MGHLVFYSDAFLTKLTWQVLIEGYLTSPPIPLNLDDLAKINRV